MITQLKQRAATYNRNIQDLAQLTSYVFDVRSCTLHQMSMMCDVLDRHLRSGVEFTNYPTCIETYRRWLS